MGFINARLQSALNNYLDLFTWHHINQIKVTWDEKREKNNKNKKKFHYIPLICFLIPKKLLRYVDFVQFIY